jgi:hypothetical protein
MPGLLQAKTLQRALPAALGYGWPSAGEEDPGSRVCGRRRESPRGSKARRGSAVAHASPLRAGTDSRRE